MTPADLALLLATLSGLASSSFRDRDAASRRLVDVPGWQTPVIWAATTHKDPEVSARAGREAERRGFTKEAASTLRAREVARRLVLKALWSDRGGREAWRTALGMDVREARLVAAEAGPIARSLGLWHDRLPPDRWKLSAEDPAVEMFGTEALYLATFLEGLCPFFQKKYRR